MVYYHKLKEAVRVSEFSEIRKNIDNLSNILVCVPREGCIDDALALAEDIRYRLMSSRDPLSIELKELTVYFNKNLILLQNIVFSVDGIIQVKQNRSMDGNSECIQMTGEEPYILNNGEPVEKTVRILGEITGDVNKHNMQWETMEMNVSDEESFGVVSDVELGNKNDSFVANTTTNSLAEIGDHRDRVRRIDEGARIVTSMYRKIQQDLYKQTSFIESIEDRMSRVLGNTCDLNTQLLITGKRKTYWLRKKLFGTLCVTGLVGMCMIFR